ncbi:hypothetical protein LTR37_010930 [Vermiconidia calcicola]|uniref:Uncharacterized protein n=1 Tax=Vermiconidia calcicola TaxID=1690605 RepID=A0ACC3N533_9PEZI|nr:hypothetical protein LTR37_010930 [Vermiconidia calcicola]
MAFDLSDPDRTIQVGVILFDSETEILDVAPVDLLMGLTKPFISALPIQDSMKAQGLDVEFHWVNQTGKTAKLTSGITIQCTDSFESCPTLDIVLMGAHTPGYSPKESELAFIRKAYESCSTFLFICGAFDAALRAGLLEGKTATAPRMLLGKLRQGAAGTNWVERRWARDGKMWTSGTLLNGLDMMRAFARETWTDRKEMVETVLGVGGWPVRDVDYKDEPDVLDGREVSW